MAGEMLGPVLASIHNLTFYQRLVARLREATIAGRFHAEASDLAARLEAGGAEAGDDDEARGLGAGGCASE
jgi:queuine tRNA-ribosyltransferase